jgi:hypothetical protein
VLILRAITAPVRAVLRYLDAVGRLRLLLARSRSLNLSLAARVAVQAELLRYAAERQARTSRPRPLLRLLRDPDDFPDPSVYRPFRVVGFDPLVADVIDGATFDEDDAADDKTNDD